MKRILILGGVAAGATAAARARRLAPDAQITILEAGPDVSFANCGLPYYLGGDIEHRSSLILASPQTFYDQYRIDVHTNTEAVAIDREAKHVTARNTQGGKEQRFPYDVLILAQGGKPIIPNLPGVEREHVHQLWTLQDMDAIDHYLATHEPRKAVVVGAGFIGLEMVEALAKRGMQVSLVEMVSQVMPNMESEFAGALQKELREYGVELKLGSSLSSISEESVELSSGERLSSDFVLLSIGVRPSLRVAEEAGLEIGSAGGLAVDSRLQTNDPAIYAAGDMLEIENRVLGSNVRIPLAGPANRQGRIAAENALGGRKEYRGAMGTSVFKLFGLNAGSTGLNLKNAREAGWDADAVVVHKASHTAYYPGSQKVSLMLIFDRQSGKVLGAQAVGKVGIDKRLDVIATAIAGGLSIEDLAELDLAYAPPFNSPNGPINMAAFTAENHRSGFSPSVLASDAERFIEERQPVVIDLRDPISFNKANLTGSYNLSHNHLREQMEQIPKDQPVLLISEDGQKGHVALRMLAGAGFTSVHNLSGGYISLERYARTGGFKQLQVGLLPLEEKRLEDAEEGPAAAEEESGEEGLSKSGPLIIDVRTPPEYAQGAHPDAVNIPLDDLPQRVDELGDQDRPITLYCASGARSAYGQRILKQMGFSNVKNGGSLHDVLAKT
jgi:NADPH-dependent 2,4-dienoyl-CoA reductase/sulfur reductase-like enzyme/rhodanese-related sulfurtransferase